MDLINSLEQHIHKTALISESLNKITYGDLLKITDNLGKKIKDRCLVFLVCNNNLESIAGLIGFFQIRAVPLLLNYTINKTLFGNLLKIYKPKFLFIPKSFSYLNKKHKIIYSFLNYNLVQTNYKIDYEMNEDLALLMTTSGSTGSPKFVRQSYKNIDSNIASISKYLKITSNDRPITTLPMSYVYGLSIILSHLLNGATIILTNASLVSRGFWEIFKKEKATTFGGVPYIYEMLNKFNFERINLPSLKYITQAGGKLSLNLSKKFIDICENKNIKFYIMYGQAEATSRMSYLPWKFSKTKPGSIGISIPGGMFWLEDKYGNKINKVNTTGELVYKGDNVSMGYAESCYDLINKDENKGILYTGDLSKRDGDNFYYIVGRKKRFLKVYGNRINLDELEELIKTEGFDCACTGKDDDLRIYTTKNKIEYLENFLIKITGLNPVAFSLINIDEIPRNSSGKIQYSFLQ